ncbi:cell wall-binding repeat-containing protein [Clostridium sp. 'White wine YQ']|uniref:cell wall-binding repeat-containing protein n=1 Tax=Clostridium sp. 'White wine YQ' TaxID=3027474 RepID=UPI0023662CA7|nr:cell wall-binding repeat-containing protein [Clostridium sp. 'White wine YQ']MDD7794971.1 cell wall-binding repeat-containing protein [Clostridium sp. 'White wine YQ']
MYNLSNKKLFKILCFSLITFLISASFILPAKAISTPSIYYSIEQSPIHVGDNFVINVNAKNIANLFGASIDLYYDKSYIQISNIMVGDIFNNSNSTYGNPVIDSANGKISFYSTLIGNIPGLNITDGTLFRIYGKALKNGTINLSTINGGSSSQSINTMQIKLSDSNGSKVSFSSTSLNLGILPPTGVSRLGGTDRYGTSTAISREGWPTGADNVVLAYAYNFPDALSAVPLAYSLNAPILLIDPNSIPSTVQYEIQRLHPKNIYILGGAGVISSNIETSLKSSYSVFRLGGNDRFETSTKIAKQVINSTSSKTAVLTTALDFPDALSISPTAALLGYPILFTTPTTLDPSTQSFILNNGINKIVIAGGSGVVSLNVENQLKNLGITIDRLAGQDRFSTSLEILKAYRSTFSVGNVITTGLDFPDALTGGVLAAKKRLPIILTNGNSIDSNIMNFVKRDGPSNLYVLGGTGLLSDDFINSIKLNQ